MGLPARPHANLFHHRDTFDVLNRDLSVDQKIESLREILKGRFPFIQRISVALYDPKTDILRTYLAVGDGDNRLQRYAAKLSDAASLAEIVQRGSPRVVNDLGVFDREGREHTRKIREAGYGASYTLPMYLSDVFFGFVFFNSRAREVFTEEVLHYLDVFGHLISLVVINEVASIRTLQASVKTAASLVHQRDVDTGSHLDRMANFARLIAREVATLHALTDEKIEHIFLFAPLHDIGKIAIADTILKKPGKLSLDEFEDMKAHTAKGLAIIDVMLSNFGLEGLQHVDMLRNIALYHHEAMNGSGYPAGLRGADIPIEARIVAVADIFDALTSTRPYKEAWTIEEAFATLRKMAGTQVDRDCVEALISCREEVEQIQRRFREDPYG